MTGQNTEPSKSEPGSRPLKVLIVCTGNTCRSPMAEGILRKLIADEIEGEAPVHVQSAGTTGMVGTPATELSIAVAGSFGVDISQHRSQGLTRRLVAESDLILALAAEHLESCHNLGATGDQLFLLKSYPNPSRNPRADSIADPIGGDRDRYEKTYFEIDEALRRSLRTILTRAGITKALE